MKIKLKTLLRIIIALGFIDNLFLINSISLGLLSKNPVFNTQNYHSWKYSNITGQIFGTWARPISGKQIQWSISEFSLKFRGKGRALEIQISKKYWMSFPEIDQTPENWKFGKISGRVIQDLPIRKIRSFEFQFVFEPKPPSWNIDEFSRNRSYPGNWNFEKILNEFSRNLPVTRPGKLKFWEKFWMSFPGCQ